MAFQTSASTDMSTVENQLVEMNETVKEMKSHQKETNELLGKIGEILNEILARTGND